MKAKTIAVIAWSLAAVGTVCLIACAWTMGPGNTSEAFGGTGAILLVAAFVLGVFASNAYDNEAWKGSRQ